MSSASKKESSLPKAAALTLDTIPSADERKAAAAKLQEKQTVSEDQTTEKQKQLEAHWSRAIATWASSSAMSDRPLIIAHAGLLSKEAIDTWTTALQGKGYKVEVDSNRITISS